MDWNSLFTEVVHNWWKILNVKNCTIGIHKKDRYRVVIKSHDDWKLDYLQQLFILFTRWSDSKKSGLTTFLAAKIICNIITKLCRYNSGFRVFIYFARTFTG